MNTLEQIGRRIRQARESKSMTQQELASKLKCNRANVSYIENGISGTTIEKVPVLCRALDVSADWLFGLAKK